MFALSRRRRDAKSFVRLPKTTKKQIDVSVIFEKVHQTKDRLTLFFSEGGGIYFPP